MGVWVSKGFLVIAQNNDTTDYVTQAYMLALSIKYSQKTVKNISLITNNNVPEKYKSVFDEIIAIPFNDDAANSNWKVENRWKLYYASPYYETIVLDTDMLLLEDISVWWNHCSMYDIKFCSKIKNYKLDVVEIDTAHRKTFIENQLPNVYFALHYFKKSELAENFYKVLEFVVNNWELCWTEFAPKEYQNWLSIDLAAAIAIEITGINSLAYDKHCPLEFIHMKVPIQGWPRLSTSWRDNVFWNLDNSGKLVVGNIIQGKLFHYVEKDFASQQTIKILEKLNGS